jgi:hypothetical protein
MSKALMGIDNDVDKVPSTARGGSGAPVPGRMRATGEFS